MTYETVEAQVALGLSHNKRGLLVQSDFKGPPLALSTNITLCPGGIIWLLRTYRICAGFLPVFIVIYIVFVIAIYVIQRTGSPNWATSVVSSVWQKFGPQGL